MLGGIFQRHNVAEGSQSAQLAGSKLHAWFSRQIRPLKMTLKMAIMTPFPEFCNTLMLSEKVTGRPGPLCFGGGGQKSSTTWHSNRHRGRCPFTWAFFKSRSRISGRNIGTLLLLVCVDVMPKVYQKCRQMANLKPLCGIKHNQFVVSLCLRVSPDPRPKRIYTRSGVSE